MLRLSASCRCCCCCGSVCVQKCHSGAEEEAEEEETFSRFSADLLPLCNRSELPRWGSAASMLTILWGAQRPEKAAPLSASPSEITKPSRALTCGGPGRIRAPAERSFWLLTKPATTIRQLLPPQNQSKIKYFIFSETENEYLNNQAPTAFIKVSPS